MEDPIEQSLEADSGMKSNWSAMKMELHVHTK
jgi:hypothetical protein